MFLKFHVKCNATYTYCTQITRNREISENEAIDLGCGATVQQNEMGLGCIAMAFCRHPRIAHYSAQIYGRFVSPAKAPWCKRIGMNGASKQSDWSDCI